MVSETMGPAFESPRRLFLLIDRDGARNGPSDRILHWTMRVGPPDEGGELLRRSAILSDPYSCPRAHWPSGDRIVDAQNSAVIRFTIDDDLDPTWFQTLLRSPHGDKCRQTAGLGGAK